MSTLPKVLAICVNWNGGEVLARTVQCLIDSTDLDLRIVVVDNASDDGSADALPAPAAVLRLPTNDGYGAALNAAVRGWGSTVGDASWQPDYYLFLNNDIHFAPPIIAAMARFAEDRGPCVCGPMVLLEERPDRLEAAWGEVSWGHVLARYHGKLAPSAEPRWNRVRRVPLLLGCCLLVHRDVVAEVGLFDERFFMYHEEVDFLHRVGRRGFPIHYCPFARIVHRSGHASRRLPQKKVYWVRRNAVLFLRKHRAGAWRWVRFSGGFILSLGWNLSLFRFARARAIWRGVRDGLTGEAHA